MLDTTVIDKINKLLALANSPNEHEAALAAQKASVLLTQYNLSLADLGKDDLTEIAELAIALRAPFRVRANQSVHNLENDFVKWYR
jgi:hypothetical protein